MSLELHDVLFSRPLRGFLGCERATHEEAGFGAANASQFLKKAMQTQDLVAWRLLLRLSADPQLRFFIRKSPDLVPSAIKLVYAAETPTAQVGTAAECCAVAVIDWLAAMISYSDSAAATAQQVAATDGVQVLINRLQRQSRAVEPARAALLVVLHACHKHSSAAAALLVDQLHVIRGAIRDAAAAGVLSAEEAGLAQVLVQQVEQLRPRSAGYKKARGDALALAHAASAEAASDAAAPSLLDISRMRGSFHVSVSKQSRGSDEDDYEDDAAQVVEEDQAAAALVAAGASDHEDEDEASWRQRHHYQNHAEVQEAEEVAEEVHHTAAEEALARLRQEAADTEGEGEEEEEYEDDTG